MTRIALCSALCALTVLLSVLTALVQAGNHSRGSALNTRKEECSMIEAINSERAAKILEHDYGPLPSPEAAETTPKQPAAATPKQKVAP